MLFSKRLFIVFLFIFFVSDLKAQQKIQTAISYVLRIDTSDLSGYDVEMHIHDAPKAFHLAMATHHEYDDRYWRYVQNLRVEPIKNNYIREDSALWRINNSGKDVIIKYRIHLPAFTGNRPVWKPFLSPTGGFAADMHSFMYLVEQPHIPFFPLAKLMTPTVHLSCKSADPITSEKSPIEIGFPVPSRM